MGIQYALPLILLFAQAQPVSADTYVGPLTFSGVSRHITENKIRSVSDLIAALPADCRQNCSLIYKSGSKHGEFVDELHPRTVLWCDGGRFIMSFTSNNCFRTQSCKDMERADEYEKAFNSVEIVEFNEATGRAMPRQIQFDEDGKESPLLITKPNEHPINRDSLSCKNCHGENFRYKWDEYKTWSGVYGSDDDKFTVSERVNYMRFIKNGRQDPEIKSRFSPLNECLQNYAKRGESPLLKGRPNLRATAMLARASARRNHAILKRSKIYAKYKNLIAFHFMRCQDVLPFDEYKEEEVNAILISVGLDERDFNISKSFDGTRSYSDGHSNVVVLTGTFIYEDLMRKDRRLKKYYKPLSFCSGYGLSEIAMKSKELCEEIDSLGRPLDFTVNFAQAEFAGGSTYNEKKRGACLLLQEKARAELGLNSQTGATTSAKRKSKNHSKMVK